MKIRKALLLAALLVLGVFFVHIVSMLPKAEDLSRAQALELRLREEFLTAEETPSRAAPLRSVSPLSPGKEARADDPLRARPVFGAKGFEFAREVCA